MNHQHSAADRLHRLIADIEAFDPSSVTTRSDPRIVALEAAIEMALIDIFGDQTPAFKEYERASNLDTASFLLDGTPLQQVIAGLMLGRLRAIVLLNQAAQLLQGHVDSAA